MNNIVKRESSGRLFLNSFLYVFGFTDNPLKQIIKNQFRISDSEKMRGDWERVGKDIQNAYEQEVSGSKQ